MLLNIASSTSRSSLNEINKVDVQPNAVDVKLDKVFAFREYPASPFFIDEENKRHSEKTELEPDADGTWYLDGGKSYEIVMEGEVTVGEGEAGWIITRSTLNRNGLFITSGLYDTGYSGTMAGMLHINNPHGAVIKRGTRVGQYICIRAESLHNYAGSYGKDSNHDKALYGK